MSKYFRFQKEKNQSFLAARSEQEVAKSFDEVIDSILHLTDLLPNRPGVALLRKIVNPTVKITTDWLLNLSMEFGGGPGDSSPNTFYLKLFSQMRKRTGEDIEPQMFLEIRSVQSSTMMFISKSEYEKSQTILKEFVDNHLTSHNFLIWSFYVYTFTAIRHIQQCERFRVIHHDDLRIVLEVANSEGPGYYDLTIDLKVAVEDYRAMQGALKGCVK